MGFFQRIFKNNSEILAKRARALVEMAKFNAVGSLSAIEEAHPKIGTIDAEKWGFFVTVGGIFIAMTRLESANLSKSNYDSFRKIILERFLQWHPKALQGFEDCKTFFDKKYDSLVESGHDENLIASDALGQWIVWNILGRSPESEEEVMIVRSIGVLVTRFFFDYWEV